MDADLFHEFMIPAQAPESWVKFLRLISINKKSEQWQWNMAMLV